MLEQEVKLQFETVQAARAAVVAAGATPVTPRRLIDDQLFDTPDGRLAGSGTALRLRRDGSRGIVTVKGPVLQGPVKSREELETPIADADVAAAMFAMLGFRPIFRAQKYREEFALDTTHVTVDEAPMGVFVEIEGTPDAIAGVTTRLGRTPADYRLESYMSLWQRHCEEHGRASTDMLFDAAVPR